MKFLSVPALLAAALFSALVGVPFLTIAQNEAGPFFFEVQVKSSEPGIAQLFFDSGAGFNERESSRAAIVGRNEYQSCRLGFPSGTFRGFRLDPLDHGARMALRNARVVSRFGRVLAEFKPQDFKPANQIAHLEPAGGELQVTIAPTADDPSLLVSLPTPLVAQLSWFEHLGAIPRLSIVTFLFLVAALVALGRSPRLRGLVVSTTRWSVTRPQRAIAVAAGAAVVLSTYPVVFLGKSFVSPNLGTILLYDDYPALPGYKARDVADVQLSDVGAIMWQHVPFSTIQHRALAHGELPLWNRYNSLGTPLLGQGQSMFGDPLHFLVIAANGSAWAWDLKYLIAKWLFATGLGLLVLGVVAPPRAVASGGQALPLASDALASALLVAAVAPFIGFFLYRLNHPAYFSLCYAPWALYCWLRIAQARDFRRASYWAAGLIVANLALMASGTAKEAYMLLLTMNFAGAGALLSAGLSWRERATRLAATAWAGVIFALLTAPLWATFFHTLKSAYTSYNAASAFQLQPAMMLGLFDEIFFRPLMPNNRLLDPSLNFVLLLGLLYFLATLRSAFTNRIAIALGVASLVPLALGFGLVPPRWIVHWPILSNVAHLDNTFGCALIVLWAVLAGVGFMHAARRLGTAEGRGDLAVVGLLLFALVFNWVAFGQAVHRPVLGPTTFSVNKPGEWLPVAPFIWGYLAVLLLASVLLLWVARRILRRQVATVPAVILLGACVVTLLWRHALHGPSVGFREFIQQPTVRVNLHAKSEAVSFLRGAVKQEPARGFGLHGNFFPGWTAVYGLETVHSPDAIMSPRVRELVEASGIERLWDWRLYVAPENVGAARPFLDALNVRWYLDLASDQGLLGRSLKLAKVADLDVYESPTAWPRAFFTDRVLRYATPAELVAAMKASGGKPLAAVQSGDEYATLAVSALSADLATRNVAPAREYRLTENTTSFNVHADRAGVIVLSESWWPDDFRAELNGRRVPVLRLNHAFKGVLVTAPGDYRVTFRYWPHHFLRSLLACGLGAALLVGSLVVVSRGAQLRH